jgi:hypothetical protein
MQLGNRRVRAAGARKRSGDHGFRPSGEWLEKRRLLTTELAGNNAAIGQLPAIANVPYGMDFGGANIDPNTGGGTFLQGAGWSVADVGSVNGAPYDDFVIGAPTVGNAGGPPNILGTGVGSAVYLVFGSQVSTSSGVSVQDWIGKTNNVFNYTPNNRVGDLAQLGLTTQQNPITGTTGGNLTLPFAGVTLFTGSNLNSNLGASVSGLKVGGLGAILLGAPGANGGNGAAYLVWGTGSAWNALVGTKVNLDSTTFNATYGLNEIVFTNTTIAGAKLGYSVAGGFNITGDGNFDVILGAPAGSVDGQAGTGAVYLASVASVTPNTSVDISTLGQSGNSQVVFAGVNSGDSAGFSVADAGDVNGVTSGGNNVDDLLIGAPAAGSGAGTAYLVYGGAALGNLATSSGTPPVRFINLNRVGTTANGTIVPGAAFNGPAGGKTGYSVSSGGDFNNDGFADILLGSPGTTIGVNANSGQVNLFYGAASTSPNFLSGSFNLTSLPTAFSTVVLQGANAGDMAGYAVANTGIINAGQPNAILIGAPGFNANAGTAYLIPGRTNFTGTFSLSAAETAPLDGNQYLLTSLNPPAAPNFFGASLSSRFQAGQQFTADGDSISDFIIGAPGYNVNDSAARAEAGGGLIIQGGLITVKIPSAGSIITNIGVGTPFAPFSINATTPAALQIFVFGTTSVTPNFMPVDDINPSTVVVNGHAFPNATLQQDPNTNNYIPDGIPDAIITISPRSALNLSPGTTTITISGSTLPTSPLPGRTWTGSASPVTVTGGTTTPIIAGLAGIAAGAVQQLFFNAPFGNTQFVPTLSALSLLNYQPIPIDIALNQFLAAPGFRDRNYSFNHPGAHLNVNFQSRGQPIGRVGGFNQLRKTVFDRGRFHPQKLYTWEHQPYRYGKLTGVVPVQDTVQRYQDIQLKGDG